MKIRLAAVCAVFCMLSASVAFGQYQPQPPPPPPGGGYGQPPPPGGGYGPPPLVHRQGFMIGFSIGGGAISANCDGCVNDSEGGFAFDFTIGGFLNPDLAIMYDASGVTFFEEGFDGDPVALTNSVNVVAAQFWLGPQFWVKGGVGFGRFFIQGDNIDIESNSGFAVLAAAGYTILVSGNFAMDVQARVAPVIYEDDFSNETLTLTNASVLLGFNWY